MGGAQAINYLISLIRVKIVAVLLGPSGVGLVGLYSSATTLIGSLTGFGIGSSGVREVAGAYSRDDAVAAARMVRVLRRCCWATGLLGWAVSIALAVPISHWMTGSVIHAWAIAVLGSTLLLGAITGGQMALLQGLRRIGDIARANVAGVVLNTLVAIGLYSWLGERGIVPVFVVSAVVTLALSYRFSSRIQIDHVDLSWTDTWRYASGLLGLGLAFMWSGLLTAGVDMFTRTLISRQLGVDAAGLYQAAWALSGMFAGFVLQAMGTDFYPRLTALIHNRDAAIRAVNEQTEIGILLALPGLLATLALAKWVVWALYSAAFAPAAGVLAWMVLGVLGRVLSWPLSFIQLAMGAGRLYIVTETIFLAIQVALVAWLVPRYGVVGAAYAFAGCYALYTAGMAWVGYRLIGFRWSPAVVRMMAISGVLVLLALAANRLLPEVAAGVIGMALAMVGGGWCLRGLASRLGDDHRLVYWMKRVPGARYVVGD